MRQTRPLAGGAGGQHGGALVLPGRMAGYLRSGLWLEHGGVCEELAELSLSRERDPERREWLRMQLAGLWALLEIVGWEQPDAPRTRVRVRSYGGLLLRALERQLEVELDALEEAPSEAAQSQRVEELRSFIMRLRILEPRSSTSIAQQERRATGSRGVCRER